MSGANPTDALAGSEPTDAVNDVSDSGPEPLFRIVRGVPTDVELAAISVVLAARLRPVEAPTPPPQGPTAWAA